MAAPLRRDLRLAPVRRGPGPAGDRGARSGDAARRASSSGCSRWRRSWWTSTARARDREAGVMPARRARRRRPLEPALTGTGRRRVDRGSRPRPLRAGRALLRCSRTTCARRRASRTRWPPGAPSTAAPSAGRRPAAPSCARSPSTRCGPRCARPPRRRGDRRRAATEAVNAAHWSTRGRRPEHPARAHPGSSSSGATGLARRPAGHARPSTSSTAAPTRTACGTTGPPDPVGRSCSGPRAGTLGLSTRTGPASPTTRSCTPTLRTWCGSISTRSRCCTR